MADDVEFQSTRPATPSVETIVAADDIAGKKYQRIKLIHGADGVNAGDVSAANPLPVTGSLTVDSEIPAAAALADNTANPTTPSLGTFPHWYDGATWDRALGTSADGLLVNLGANNDVTVTGSVTANAGTNLNTSALALEAGGNLAGAATSLALIDNPVVVDDAAFTPATTSVMMAGAEFDDTTPDSVDEGDAGALRMSANRNLYMRIRDNAGNERGANVTASGELNVLDSNSAAMAASLSVLDDWDETNRAAVNLIASQVAITGGAGAVAANTPRVTLASDDPGVAHLANIVTSTQLIDDSIVADDAAFTPATTKVQMAGFEFDDTTPDSVDEGDAGAARMSANRNQYVQIRDNAGNERGLNIDASGQLAVTLAAAQTLATVTTVSAVTAISNALPAGDNNIGNVDVVTVPADPFGANADAASATGSISAKLRFIAGTGIPITGTVTVDSELTTADLDTGAGTDTRAVVGLVGSASGGGALIPGSATDGLLVNLGANNDVTVTGTITANAGTGTFTVDSELPAAAALADATANPTAPLVGAALELFNGTTWDRVRGDTTNGVDVDVTRLPALVAGTANIGDVDVLTVPAPLSTTGGGTEATALRVTLASDSTGLVSVDDNAGSLTVDAPVATPVFVRLSDGAAAIATLPVSLASVPSHAVTNAGTFAVQADSVIPGTGATNLGKAVDTATGATDTGVLALATRDDALTALTPIDGDNVQLRVDANGALWTSVSAALPAGTNAIGKLAANSGVDIGDVDVTTVGTITPGTAPTSLGKAEDGAHTTGDVGVMGLAVRQDTPANLSNADGDYEPLQMSGGKLWVKHLGNFATVTTQVTRPADTTAYAANDTFSDSTTTPTTFTLTGAARISGGSGVIMDAVLGYSTTQSFQGELWIFDAAVTSSNDNAAFALSDADRDKLVAVIPFTTSAAATNNASAHVSGLNIGFTCVGTANLRFMVKVITGYTPAASDVFTARLKILQVD
mgnify:CR=1 FL=1